MAGKQDISTALKRQLRSGKEYDKLMPAVKCESTPLGEGDTFFTVDQMRAWIEKYRWQTAKLALALEGQTLQETIDNIYRFLYDHVQYQADGALQQLRSPACTWASRKEGTDCKSFSVFASSILSNLGIKHMIRQVRQPYFYPEEFTHVYVVVPKDQSKTTYPSTAPTFVLDATRHENTEVQYLEKSDLFMPQLMHVGLNAPQDERTRQIIENFDAFCNHLLQNGISTDTVKAIREQVNRYTSAGQDPSFHIVKDGIVIGGKMFPLQFKQGLSGSSSDSGSDSGDGGSADAYIAAGKKLMDMLPADFFENTFGSIFANGFRLGCWNTSSSPAKAKEEIAIDAPYLYKLSGLENTVNTINVNKFVVYMEAYIASRTHASQQDFAECTKDGHKMAKQLLEQFYQESMAKIKQQIESNGGVLSTNGLKTIDMVTFPLKSGYADNNFKHGNVRVPVYSVTKTGNSGNSGGSYSGDQSQNNGGSTASASKSNTGIIIGGVALAAMPFLLPMMKKGAMKKTGKKK
ncbi:MAG: hypothetical protein WBL21_00105 [Salinimicrobium sp.]